MCLAPSPRPTTHATAPGWTGRSIWNNATAPGGGLDLRWQGQLLQYDGMRSPWPQGGGPGQLGPSRPGRRWVGFFTNIPNGRFILRESPTRHKLELTYFVFLFSQIPDEVDSHMFQTIGHDVVENQARCLDMPLFRRSLQ